MVGIEVLGEGVEQLFGCWGLVACRLHGSGLAVNPILTAKILQSILQSVSSTSLLCSTFMSSYLKAEATYYLQYLLTSTGLQSLENYPRANNADSTPSNFRVVEEATLPAF